jgi:creatinine amidohydrolase/Fe(II)-dependent formamide hydrolase-like protein
MSVWRFLCACVLVAAAAGTYAAAPLPSTVYLEELTWTELRDLVAAGKTIAIVPVGGTEQSGPHMALGKHNVRVRVLAGRIAASLGNALVAPVIAYVPEGSVNPPSAHMRFPGTITIPDAAFETTLEYAARSMRLAGFRDVVLIGDHGGYQANLEHVAERLNREWAGSPVRVHAVLEYYRAADREYAHALEHEGFKANEIGTHAGLADTALSLAVDPKLVRTDKLRTGGPAEGVHGDPRKATAELGKAGLDIIVARTRDAIQRETARH